MSLEEPAPSKVCVVCGQDCSGRPRVKDRLGRYYCRECHDKEQQRKAASAAAAPAQPAAPRAAPPASAAPPRRAAAPSARPAAAAREEVVDLLSEMAEAELATPATDRNQVPCPSCRTLMAADAVICMRCGFDRRTGRRLTEPPLAPPPVPAGAPAGPYARPQRGQKAPRAGGGGMSGGMDWLAGVIPAGLFVVLFIVAKTNESMVQIYGGAQGLFGLAVGIMLLVGAFKDGAGQGLLCLCVPFYALYWVYGRNDNVMLKWLVAADILAGAMTFGLKLPAMP